MGNIKKVPLRKCIGCNEMKNKKEMMRVLKNKGLERSLKMQIPQEVYENLERELDTIEL